MTSHTKDPETVTPAFGDRQPLRWITAVADQVAAEAGLAYGFKELGLERIWAEALTANTASVRILRSLGMQETGRGAPGMFLGEDSYFLQFSINRRAWTHEGDVPS